MFKSLCMIILFVTLFYTGAFAKCKLDKEDFKLGPFQVGDTWNLPLAEKHLGPLDEEGGSATDFFLLGEDGNADFIYLIGEKSVSQFIFQSDDIRVMDNRIRQIFTTNPQMETSRKIRVGDSYEQLKKAYKLAPDLVKALDSHIGNKATSDQMYRGENQFLKVSSGDAEMVLLGMYMDINAQRYQLSILIERQSGEIHSLGIMLADIRSDEDINNVILNYQAETIADEDLQIGPFKIGGKWDEAAYQKAVKLFGQEIKIFEDGDDVFCFMTEDNKAQKYHTVILTKGKKVIINIILENPQATIATSKGLKINDPFSKAVELYGQPTTKGRFDEENNRVSYLYGNDHKGMILTVENGKITRIQVYNGVLRNLRI